MYICLTYRPLIAGLVAATLFGCSSQQQISPSNSGTSGPSTFHAKHHHHAKRNALEYGTPLRHIVVVLMENRTVDDLFQNFPGADTQAWGLGLYGNHVTLVAEPLDTAWDPIHSHLPPNASTPGGFATENDNFRNDGWANEHFVCNGSCSGATAYAYVKKSDVQPYYDLASSFTLADEVYQDNEGPSYVAHQYLIAGQANGYTSSSYLDAAENPSPTVDQCPNMVSDVQTVDLTAPYPGSEKTKNEIAPCQDYSTIFDLVDTAAGGGYPNVNWKSYVPATTVAYWNGPMVVNHLYNLYTKEGGDGGTGNFIVDQGLYKFTNNVANGKLPPLSFIVPCPAWSDHPGMTGQKGGIMLGRYGPSFVGYIANTIGQSKQYWTNEPTAVVVIWDDWGGWFDHNVPFENPNRIGNQQDPNNYGYRTPMLVISPYPPYGGGAIDGKQKTQSAILTFIERAFSTGELGTSDDVMNSQDDMIDGTDFNFNEPPVPYKSVQLQSGAPAFGSSGLKCPNPDFDG
ncbi:MAG TPA: alkaline phosphatase family protein [Candidatus Cybelea sp.]|jgi:phospholipase C